jgi:hypothetical protein
MIAGGNTGDRTGRLAEMAGRADPLGDRLTVGQLPLTQSVQVRILVAQPKVDAQVRGERAGCLYRLRPM